MTEAKSIQSLRSIFNRTNKSNVIVLGGDDSDDSMLDETFNERTPINLVSGGDLDDAQEYSGFVPDIKSYDNSWLNIDKDVPYLGGDHITIVSGIQLVKEEDNIDKEPMSEEDKESSPRLPISIVDRSEIE